MAAYGINFRSSLAYVTDTSPDVWPGVSPDDNEYPHTYSNGLTAGWTDGANIELRDRNTTHPRLAGWQGANNLTKTFRADLPAAGTYPIQAAFGDYNYTRNVDCDFYDNTTLLQTVDGSTGAAASFLDATDVVRTAAQWVAGTNNRGNVQNLTFATTTFLLTFPANGEQNVICHLYIGEPAGAANRPMPPTAVLTAVSRAAFH